jgi:hypothetical protein
VNARLQKYSLGEERDGTANISKILKWALLNTAKRIVELMPYTIGQTVSAIHKADAFSKHFYNVSNICDEDLEELVNACTQAEVLELEEMYGHQRGMKKLETVALERLRLVRESHLAKILVDRVQDIAPLAKVYCTFLEEEQEKELEYELDEERQVERPPPATPRRSEFSPELHAYASFNYVEPCLRNYGDMRYLEKMGFKGFSEFFKETSYASKIGDQLGTSTVLVTTDFIYSVEEKCEKDFYLKRFRWILRMPCEGDFSAAILISNFEAENLFRNKTGNRKIVDLLARLHSFVPVVKRGQTVHEQLGGLEPLELNVFGGSINAEGSLHTRMKRFLGLHPDPIAEWGRLYREGAIESDGFVPLEMRLELGMDMSSSPFRESPVPMMLRFLSDSRHLGADLRTSAFGGVLGTSEDS